MDPEAPDPGNRSGATTVAPDVLVTIARLTALQVPGVAGMAPVPGGVNRLFRRGAGEGVRISIEDGSVTAELYLLLMHDTNVREVSRKVQVEVKRAIEEMVGMHVTQVDVHIEDIEFNQAAAEDG